MNYGSEGPVTVPFDGLIFPLAQAAGLTDDYDGESDHVTFNCLVREYPS
jgi:hypothetical protein